MTIEAWMPFDAKKNKMNLALSAQILAVIFCVPFSYRAIGKTFIYLIKVYCVKVNRLLLAITSKL